MSKLPVCLELVFARIQQSVTAVSGDFEVRPKTDFVGRRSPIEPIKHRKTPKRFFKTPYKVVSHQGYTPEIYGGFHGKVSLLIKGNYLNPQHVVFRVLPDASEPHLQKLSELG